MNVDTMVEKIKAKFDHDLAKHYLKEKYQSKLIFADQGGLWKATPEFLSFLSTPTLNEIVLLDLYDNPVKVNKELLVIIAHKTYHDVMTEWHEEWSKISKLR